MRIIFLLFLSLSLAACGFHLRGPSRIPFETLSITGASPALGSELGQAIRAASDTRIVNQGWQLRLEVLQEKYEKVILSLNAAGRVREFELRYRVVYRLVDPKMKEIVRPHEIYLTRNMSYDDTQVLAKGEEEILLDRDMQKDAVNQILRQISAAGQDAY